MNQIKCPRLIRGTVYILIMERRLESMSNNLGFRKHVTILNRKLFALFSSSCLASVTHEALTLPGKHEIQDVSKTHHPMPFKRLQAKVSALGARKHKTPSLHLTMLWVMCVTVFVSKHGFLSFHRCLPQKCNPHLSSLEKKVYEWVENVSREVSSSWTAPVCKLED